MVDRATDSNDGAKSSLLTTSQAEDYGATSTRAPSRPIQNVNYSTLLSKNTNLRYYWLSFVVNRMGDWLTLLASISLIGDAVGTNAPNYNTYVSILLVTKSLPNVLFMPLGGILADKYDRRHVQILLNAASACLVVVFLWAYHYKSVVGVWIANFLQDSLGGLYAPSESAMVPQLLLSSGGQQHYDQELKKATTLMSLTWSLMAAVGSALGGVLVATFGIKGCYWIDSLTYLVAMLLLQFGVSGNFNVFQENDLNDALRQLSRRQSSSSQMLVTNRRRSSLAMACDGNPLMGAGMRMSVAMELDDDDLFLNEDLLDNNNHNETTTAKQPESKDNMFVQGLKFAFVQEPLVGSYALLKGCMSLTVAAQSILNVRFSETKNNNEDSSMRLGFLFACIGLGSIIGSYIADVCSDLSKPKLMSRICVLGFFIIATSFGVTGILSLNDHFAILGFAQTIRAVGCSMIWVDSSLLIQKFTPPGLLGRINSIDTTGALLGESLSNVGVGLLMDNVGLGPESVSFLLGGLGLLFFALWSPLAFRAPKEPLG